jgi:hypothetical protein
LCCGSDWEQLWSEEGGVLQWFRIDEFLKSLDLFGLPCQQVDRILGCN